MLAGPNGSGKSSFFDALNVWHGYTSLNLFQWQDDYHVKVNVNNSRIRSGMDIEVNFHDDVPDKRMQKKAFYFRSAYRNDPDFNVQQFHRQEDLLNESRVQRMIDNDVAVGRNYQRLVSQGLQDVYETEDANTTIGEFRQKIMGEIQSSFQQIFPDTVLNSLGNPLEEGTFKFSKGSSKAFLFKNLSGGEKATFDLIVDLVVARRVFDSTIYCIDEPEAHMNTRLQADLCSALLDLIPEDSQLMLATHSIGMMRQAMEIEKNNPGSVIFLDFGELDFDSPQVIQPVVPNRLFWRRQYNVALDDLAALVAPSRVIMCEGTPRAGGSKRNHNQDARCYDRIFENEFPKTRFISTGNSKDVENDLHYIGESLSTLIHGIELLRLIDRDDLSDEQVAEKCREGIRVLPFRNLETLLFDDELLYALATAEEKAKKGIELVKVKSRLLKSSQGAPNDLKPICGELFNECRTRLRLTSCGNDKYAFMRDTMAPLVTPETQVYKLLKKKIFNL